MGNFTFLMEIDTRVLGPKINAKAEVAFIFMMGENLRVSLKMMRYMMGNLRIKMTIYSLMIPSQEAISCGANCMDLVKLYLLMVMSTQENSEMAFSVVKAL